MHHLLQERGATPPPAGMSPQSSSPANGKASGGKKAVATLRSDTAKGSLTEARLPAAATTAALSQSRDPAAPAEASKASFSTSSQPGSPPADGGSGLPGRPAAAKPPRSRCGSRGQVSLDLLQEPSAGSRPQLEQVSDSAGSDKLRTLKKMFLPADGTSPQPQQQAAPPASSSGTADAPLPPAELAHVLSLLSRLLSASAVLVDLHDPPVAYIRCGAGTANHSQRRLAAERSASGVRLQGLTMHPSLHAPQRARPLHALQCCCSSRTAARFVAACPKAQRTLTVKSSPLRRDQAGLRAGNAREVRGMDGYQEVELLRRGGRLLGMLGAATPGAGSMPNPMLSQVTLYTRSKRLQHFQWPSNRFMPEHCHAR